MSPREQAASNKSQANRCEQEAEFPPQRQMKTYAPIIHRLKQSQAAAVTRSGTPVERVK
jgi:hypothetical protein